MVVATAERGIALRDARPTDTFESINREGERLWFFETADEADAVASVDALYAAGATARSCEVERDCGMFNRAEAPQYYRPVTLFEVTEETLRTRRA